MNTIEYDEETIEQLEKLKSQYGNEKLIDTYIENGGVMNFAGKYTVFGQVFVGKGKRKYIKEKGKGE